MPDKELSDLEKRIISEGFSPAVIRDFAKDMGLGTKFIESVESTVESKIKSSRLFTFDPYKEDGFDNDDILKFELNEIDELEPFEYSDSDIVKIKAIKRNGLQSLVNVLSEVKKQKWDVVFGRSVSVSVRPVFDSSDRVIKERKPEETSELVKRIQDKKVERGSDLRMMEIYSIIDDYIKMVAKETTERKIPDINFSVARKIGELAHTMEEKVVKKTNAYIEDVLDNVISEKVEKCVEVKTPAPLIDELMSRLSVLESKLEAKDALITKLMSESVASLEFNTKIAGVCDGNTKDLNKAFDDVKLVQADIKVIADKILNDKSTTDKSIEGLENKVKNISNVLSEKGVDVEGTVDFVMVINNARDMVDNLEFKMNAFVDKIKDYDRVLYCVKEVVSVLKSNGWKLNELKMAFDDISTRLNY